ncbi:MAG TPA: FG-GAP-like repeat-containing protein [Candidatus Dormibacteraeota bacterium]|nr:FG-GAP-like repeat-containing protein [Candidatus Dormibacteraeota bacterium]
MTKGRLALAVAIAIALSMALGMPAWAAGSLFPPTNVTATAISTSGIVVSWSPAAGAGGYQVLRGAAHGGPYTLVGSTGNLQLTDGGLQPATTYYYVVRSTERGKTSGNSAEVSATTRSLGPTNLRATANGARVDLSWDGVTGAVRYDVLRSGADPDVLVGSTTGTQLTDTTAADDAMYSYRVRAFIANGASADSRALTVRTGLLTSTTLTASPAPSEAGQDILLIATVLPADGTVTRYTNAVDFFADDKLVASAPVEDWRGGVADVRVELPEGTHVIYAHNEGDDTSLLGSSSSALLTQVVQPAYARVNFAPYQAYSVGSWPTSVAIADVTGDGLADALLTTTTYSGQPDRDFKLWVFAQQADHTLAAPVALTTDGPSGGGMVIATGDLDGDGRIDVAVSVAGGVDVFLQGPGGLAAPVLVPLSGGGVRDLRIADVNGDGRGDLVVAADQVAVYPSVTGGTFGAPIVVEPAVRSQVEVADLDGDGRPDVLTMLNSVFYEDLQTAAGGFVQQTSRQVPTGYFPVADAITVGDLNGDGRPDVAATVDGNVPGSRLQVYAQDATGIPAAPVTYSSYDSPEPLVLADVNGDGRRDLIDAHGGWLDAGVLLQRPDGRLGAEQLFGIPYASSYQTRGLAVGDLNGDGRPDIAVADYNNGLVVLRQT